MTGAGPRLHCAAAITIRLAIGTGDHGVKRVSIDLHHLVVVNPAVFAAALDNSAVLLDIQSGRYFEFNAVGSDIWTRIAQPQRVDALCDALARSYDGPPDRIQTSVLAFLSHLAERNLIAVQAE